MLERDFDPPLDPGIAKTVIALRAAGVETFESCEGGEGHTFDVPTIRFRGTARCGFLVLGLAMKNCWPVVALQRSWKVIENEVTGPHWELVFSRPPG